MSAKSAIPTILVKDENLLYILALSTPIKLTIPKKIMIKSAMRFF